MSTNNTDGAALLPVTQADRELAIALFEAGLLKSPLGASAPDDMVIARWRKGILGEGDNALQVIARQSSSNAGGVNVPLLELVAGYADYKAISDDRWEQGKAAGYRELGEMVSAALASLSTPTAEPTGEGDPLHDLRRSVAEKQAARERDNPPVYADPSDPRFAVGSTTPPTPDRIGKDAVREAVIEECAKVADNWNPGRKDRVTETGIAEAIRALTPSALSGDAP